MTYLDLFRQGNLILPRDLLFHFHEIFDSSDDFLLWQFFYLQNTTACDTLAPSQIAESIGKTITEVNRMILHLTEKGLLEVKTVEVDGEIEAIFDASPVLKKLDRLLLDTDTITSVKSVKLESNSLKDLVTTFEKELGRMLSPFEIEDLTKIVQEDCINLELIREALREAVLNGKVNWKYIQAILWNWRREGITSVAQVEAQRQEREAVDMGKVVLSDDFKEGMWLWRGDE